MRTRDRRSGSVHGRRVSDLCAPSLVEVLNPDSCFRSSTGIVNVYDASTASTSGGEERKALKAVGNLTTAVTSMRFNHDSQLLALASRTNKDELKLVCLLPGGFAP